MGSRRHNGIDIAIPASREPISASVLVGLLRDVADSLYPAVKGRRQRAGQLRYNALTDTIRRFEAFIAHVGVPKVTVSEELIREFGDHLAEKGVANGYVRIYRSTAIRLLNKLPAPYLQRQLVSLAQSNRERRFDRFSGPTQRAFEDFLQNGKKLRKGSTHQSPVLSANLLSDVLRKQIIDSTLTFLSAIEADDIFAITEDDVDEFVEYHDQNGCKATAHKVLDYIRPLFSNLRCQGHLQTDLLRAIPRQVSGVNLDYVDQEAIDKLADLSSVDMDNFRDVRGRLLCFSLDYDYALRNRESSLVRCSDFNGVELHLPREIQKVKKDTLPIYSYFPETTGPLLKRYLELRAMKAPDSNLLMIACDGNPLGASGCRRAVQEHCENLGLKTHGGKPVAPHRLRHSFGSLNIEPLGIGLSLVEIKDQLRHSSIQMTYDVYLAKNPLHKKLSYDRRMAKINGTGSVGPSHVQPPASPISSEPTVAAANADINEGEAWKRVRALGLNGRSLRSYAVGEGKAQKYGKGYVYSAEFVHDLAANYFTRAEAIDMLKMARATFFDWTKKEGVDFLLIGQVSLFRKDLIMEKRRSG